MWLILRTDARKEDYVCRQLTNLGFQCWNPVQVVACRPAIARRIMSATQLRAYREVSLLPRRVFISEFSEAGYPLDCYTKPRHALDVECHSNMDLVRIPDRQITAFKAAIDAENTAALALSQTASRRQKRKWKALHDALVEMMEQAKSQLEKAA